MHNRAAELIYASIRFYPKKKLIEPYFEYIESNELSSLSADDRIRYNHEQIHVHTHLSLVPTQFVRAFRDFSCGSIARKLVIEKYFGTSYEGAFKEYVDSFDGDATKLMQDIAPYILSMLGVRFKDGVLKPDKKFQDIFTTNGNKIVGEVIHYSDMVYAAIKKNVEKQHTLLEFEEEELEGLSEEQIENSIKRRLVDTRNSRLVGSRESLDEEELIEANAIIDRDPYKTNLEDNIKTAAKFIKESYDARREDRSEVA